MRKRHKELTHHHKSYYLRRFIGRHRPEGPALFWCFSDNKPPVQLGVDKKALAKERTSCGKMRVVWQSLLTDAPPELDEWNESIIRQLVDTVKVISAEEIVVYLQGGIEITQQITK